MEKCGNIPEVKLRNIRMINIQVVELKKETTYFYPKGQLNSKSHIWKIAVFKHGSFPYI
jgi:hypothetical protein